MKISSLLALSYFFDILGLKRFEATCMYQVLDGFPTPSAVLSRALDLAAWQINSSILKRLQDIKWGSSIYDYELRKFSGAQCFPVYYRTYSRKGEIKEEGTPSRKTLISELCNFFFTDLVLLKLGALKIWHELKASLFPLATKEKQFVVEDTCDKDCGACSMYLVGNPYWRPDKLTKPICFVVDNTNWSIRFSLLSTPLVHALCLGSKDLLQAI